MRVSRSMLLAAAVAATPPASAETLPIGMLKFVPSELGIKVEGDPKKIGSFQTLLLDTKIPIDKLDQVLGIGYDYLTGTILKEPCVVSKTLPDIPAGGTGQPLMAEKFEYLNAVSDMSTHQSASGQSAGFNFTYKLISLGGEGETQSENYFNSVDGFARIYSRFVTRTIERVSGKWAPGIEDLAKKNDKKRFLEVCGTHYIAAVYYGHVIDQTIRFTLNDDKRTKADKATLTLGIGKIFGASYGTNDREADARSVSRLSVVDQSRGIITANLPDPQKVGGVQAAASYAHLTFPGEVAASKSGSAEALFVDVQPYYTLNQNYAQTIPRLSQALMAQISAKASLYETLLSAISDINNAGKLSDAAYTGFYKGTKAGLPMKLADATKLKIDFAKAVDDCVKIIRTFGSDDPGKVCSDKLNLALSPQQIAAVSLEQN
ncbi:MAG: hypothetical protein QOF41_1194 [Methylobacteriaceae bacterium]|nr:hypothetical protein [Methylobacteriaceae bacterium]